MKDKATVVKADYGDFGPHAGVSLFVTKSYKKKPASQGAKVKKAAHPGFKAVQASIAKKQGISKERAGAIVAAGARKASKKAVAANPRLKRVSGVAAKKKGK